MWFMSCCAVLCQISVAFQSSPSLCNLMNAIMLPVDKDNSKFWLGRTVTTLSRLGSHLSNCIGLTDSSSSSLDLKNRESLTDADNTLLH